MGLLSRGLHGAHHHWDPSKHPRDAHGRFRPRLSQSIRVSPISVSYNAGARFPVSKHANVYVGALVRVENARGGAAFKKQSDAAVNKLLGRHKDTLVGKVLKGEDLSIGSARIRRSQVVHRPTVRVTRARYQPQGVLKHSTIANTQPRRPRAIRKPRQSRKAITAGRRVR